MPKHTMTEHTLLTSSGWDDYEILDSGNTQKLERFGPVKLTRFEPQAVWKPALPLSEWQNSDAIFRIEKGKQNGDWQFHHPVPKEWEIGLNGLTVQLRIHQSRHIGIFPEQLQSWLWIENLIHSAEGSPKILNLFGYTGIASLFAARAGAEVTHVDASRSSLKWAQQNQQLSGLTGLPIRWIVDDAFKFVEREERRGNHYDGIILDPPRFGRGPNGEVWKFDKTVSDLLHACRNILSPDPLFLYLTAYDVQAQPVEIFQWVKQVMPAHQGRMEYGWLVQQEKSAGRKINQSMFVRWWRQS